MAIHRSKGSDSYSTISNEGADDNKMSWESKGLLWFLLTEPGDQEVEAVKKEDPDFFASTIEELRLSNYVFEWLGSDSSYHIETFESKEDGKEWLAANEDKVDRFLRLRRGGS